MTIETGLFRNTMALFPGAVTIITTGSGDLRRGITATAVCSVTDSPPSLLVCANTRTGTCIEIERSGRFSVQLLAAHQMDIAMTFAGAGGASGDTKFGAGDWITCPAGLPRLKGSIASISCRVTDLSEAGTHKVFIGAIEDVALGDAEGAPLVYAQSAFRTLAAVA